MKVPTFKDWVSAIFAILCLIALICMYFFNTKVDARVAGGIVVAFVAAFKDFASYLISSSSSSASKDETITKAIDSLANSTPIIPNESKQ